tara:strand:- start:328 stop:624 length:297 start_codon:yes stop_codon:yes gene_type:complete
MNLNRKWNPSWNMYQKMKKDDEQLYHESMQNAYLIITEKLTFADLFEYNGCYLPFHPKKQIEDKAYDDLIDYFCSLEEYEKCAEIKKAKENKNIIKFS